VTIWDSVPGHADVVAQLQGAARQPVHAYLLVGPPGAGARAAATAFAGALVCENGGCGECRDCVRVLSDAHPDVLRWEPEGAAISVEQVRDEIVPIAFGSPVESARRGNGGERFVYRLLLYDAKPDFKVTITGVEPTIAAGAGKEFIATATRIDGFDGDIRLEISGLPKGFSALTPLVIQAGHLVAKGTINAAADATAPSESEATSAKVTATAMIHGQTTTREVNGVGKMTLASKPKLFVEPAAPVAEVVREPITLPGMVENPAEPNTDPKNGAMTF